MGQTHDKHREPECKLVTMKHHLFLTPRQYGTATPPAQLSLGTSSTSTCLSVDLQHTATLDTITELLEKIDKESIAGSKLFSTPIADFCISVSKQHWHPLYHRENAKVMQMKERGCLYPLRTHQVPVTWPKYGIALLLGFPGKNSLCALRMKTNGATSNARFDNGSALGRTGKTHILYLDSKTPAKPQATCS